MKKTFLDFKKWVKSIQTAGYNGARMVINVWFKKTVTKRSSDTLLCLVTFIRIRFNTQNSSTSTFYQWISYIEHWRIKCRSFFNHWPFMWPVCMGKSLLGTFWDYRASFQDLYPWTLDQTSKHTGLREFANLDHIDRPCGMRGGFEECIFLEAAFPNSTVTRDVTTGATSIIAVTPKFSDALTLSQPGWADFAHHKSMVAPKFFRGYIPDYSKTSTAPLTKSKLESLFWGTVLTLLMY